MTSILSLASFLPRTKEDLLIDKIIDAAVLGPSVITLVHRCVDDYLMHVSGHVCTGAPGDDRSDPPRAEGLRTRCWEQLHTGHWCDVSVTWRRLYSYASMFLAAERLSSVQASADGATSRVQTASDGATSRVQTAADGDTSRVQTASDGAISRVQAAADGATSRVQTASDGATSRVQTAADGATSRVQTASDGAISRVQTASDGAISRVQAASDGATSRVQTAADGATSRVQTAADGATSRVQTAADGTTSRVQTASDGAISRVQAALLACDMGLIMGAPILDRAISRLAHRCHDWLVVSMGSDTFTDLNNCAVKKLDVLWPCESPISRMRSPSIESFCRDVFGQKPVVLQDCVEHWQARDWTLAGLCGRAGYRTVPVELGARYTDTEWSQRLMLLSQFVRDYVVSSSRGVGYLAQYELFEQVPELAADLGIPEFCHVGEEEDVHMNVWLGPAGTVSPLHHDPKHNCLVQLLGYKYVRVFSPLVSESLYPHTSRMLSNTSQVDVACPDLERFPRFADADYQETVLSPGDILYMPPGWWHYVRSETISCSVSYWFQ